MKTTNSLPYPWKNQQQKVIRFRLTQSMFTNTFAKTFKMSLRQTESMPFCKASRQFLAAFLCAFECDFMVYLFMRAQKGSRKYS